MTEVPTTVARLTCDKPTARRLASTLGEIFGAGDTACAAFEDAGGRWQVAIYFREAPDEAALRAQVARVAGDDAAAAVAIEPVAPADWVKESLSGLAPIRAGRFIVHGAHDRASVKPNDIGLEIEAALAFGTGHHGTTRGCRVVTSHPRDLRAQCGLVRRFAEIDRHLPAPPGVLEAGASGVAGTEDLAER